MTPRWTTGSATDVDERHPSIAQSCLSTRAVTLALDLFLSAVLYLLPYSTLA